MSVLVTTAVWQHSKTTSHAALNLLLALADWASDDGVTWYKQDTLAAKSRSSVRQVRRVVAELVEAGELQTREVQDGRVRFLVYRVCLEGVKDVEYDRLPFSLQPFDDRTECPLVVADDRTPEVLTIGHHAGTGASAVPCLETSGKRTPPVAPPPSWPARVGTKMVTAKEGELATAILDEWNRAAGQTLAAKSWLVKIVGRVREHPELTLDDHAHLIAAALAAPWWDGAASPSVVYGNDAMFERQIESARNPRVKDGPMRFGRGMTTQQVLAKYGVGA